MKALLVALLWVIPGCMSFEPVVLATDAGDASVVPTDTGVSDTAAETPPSECWACILGEGEAGPGCGKQWTACKAYQTCEKTVFCARDNGCLENKDFKGILDCGLPCAKAAGLTDQTSPEAAAILEIVACAEDACAKACHNVP